MHVEPDTIQHQQPNNSIDLVDLSRTLLRIVAHLPKSEYHEDKSTEQRRRADVLEHADPADPASVDATSQG